VIAETPPEKGTRREQNCRTEGERPGQAPKSRARRLR
jgi:hypothetical protein